MAKLKSKMIDDVLNEFLEPLEAYAEMDTEFAYWYSDSRITYTLCMPATGKDYFMENWHNLAPELDVDPFLASFLHEVFHHLTLNTFTEEQEEYNNIVKKQLDEELQHKDLTEEEVKRIHFQYFYLPVEFEATMGAINYIRSNVDEVARFWKKLQAAIMEFYEVNHIEINA